LHVHLVLSAAGVTQGLWSPLRGLAREHEAYYARLNNADLPRRNDLDGRGPLSHEELVAFAAWFLDLCLDQARFMGGLLGLAELRSRIDDLLRFLGAHPWSVNSEQSVVKPDAAEALHYVAIAGPIERARFMAMTGLPSRTARRVLASLLHFGVLTGTTANASVRRGTDQKTLARRNPATEKSPLREASSRPQRSRRQNTKERRHDQVVPILAEENRVHERRDGERRDQVATRGAELGSAGNRQDRDQRQ
jgi:hypothetical protein